MFPTEYIITYGDDVREQAKEFVKAYEDATMDTPIYNAMKREYEDRKKAKRDAEIFQTKADVQPRESFDVEKEEFSKIRGALLGALYESVAHAQPTVHKTFHDDADVFNSGVNFAAEVIEAIFNEVQWDD